MPTVLRTVRYRFFFYSADREELPHVHVERDECRAKFWLEPVRLHDSAAFKRPELGRLERTVQEHQDQLLRAWHDFFTP